MKITSEHLETLLIPLRTLDEYKSWCNLVLPMFKQLEEEHTKTLNNLAVIRNRGIDLAVKIHNHRDNMVPAFLVELANEFMQEFRK